MSIRSAFRPRAWHKMTVPAFSTLDIEMAKLFGAEVESGQYRVDSVTGRYVELLRCVPSSALSSLSQKWWVMDVLTSQCYFRNANSLLGNPAVPEMVVIAWAAQDRPGVVDSGD